MVERPNQFESAGAAGRAGGGAGLEGAGTAEGRCVRDTGGLGFPFAAGRFAADT